jgi:cyclopropane fatty-acyl-phospholipid synthase-like methyltransferase
MKIDHSYYDKDYFEGGSKAYQAYERDILWTILPDVIVREFNPKRVFEIGPAYGFLMEGLLAKGIEVKGIEISAWAHSQIREDVRAHCFLGDVRNFQPLFEKHFRKNYFDLIVSFETLEHLKETDLKILLRDMITWGREFLFSIFCGQDHGGDLSHQTIKPRNWWEDLFVSHGFKENREIEEKISKVPRIQDFQFEIFVFGK